MAQSLWDGSSSTDWFDPENWSGDMVPTPGTRVEISDTSTNPLQLQGVVAVDDFTVGGTSATAPVVATITGPATSLTGQVAVFAVNADATLTVSAGAQINSGIGTSIGGTAGHLSTLILDGAGTTLDTFSLNFGGLGDSALIIRNGATVDVSGAAQLGAPAFLPNQSVTVTGTGSQWLVGGTLDAGYGSTSTLTVEDGGVVQSGAARLGIAEASPDDGTMGIATIRGPGSAWIVNGALQIGDQADAIVTLADGGSISATSVGIGARGTLNIGAGSGAATAAPGTLTTATVTGSAPSSLIVFNHDADDYVFAPVIAGAGGVRVDNGTTIFTAANTYAGTMTISGGTLQIGNGGTTGSLGTGNVVADGTLAINRSDNLTINNQISGSGGVTQSGTGTTTLRGVNSYDGVTTVSSGVLIADGAAALGSAEGGTVVNGGRLTLRGGATFDEALTLNGGELYGDPIDAFTGAIAINGDARISGANSSIFKIYGDINGTGHTLTLGGGSKEFHGDISGISSLIVDSQLNFFLGTNSYTGPTIINAGGRLSIANGAAIADTGAVIVSGIFDVFNSETIGSLAGNGMVILGYGEELRVGGNDSSTNYSGTIMELQAGDELVKIGTGTLTLSGVNSYTGATTVEAGTLALEGGAAIADIGTVDVRGALDVNTSETIGSLSGGGIVTLGNGAVLTTGGDDTTTAFSGTIGDTGGANGLIKAGTGTFTLSGANSYSGTTTVASGALRIQNSAALGTTAGGTLVADGAALELADGIAVGGEALTLNGTGVADGGALRNISGNNSYAGTIALGSGARITADAGRFDLEGVAGGGHDLSVGGAGDVIFNSAIANIANFTKDGTGTVTLAGTNMAGNDFTGAIDVNAGTLLINRSVGDAANRSASVMVGANGTLGGSGAFLGDATIAGGTLTPGGDNMLGTLTVAGDLVIGNGSSLVFDLGAPGPDLNTPGQSDHIVINGDLTIGTSTLIVTNLGGSGPGLYNLFRWDGSLNVTGGGFSPPPGNQLQVLTADKQINLVVTQGLTLNLWNANGLAGPGGMGGGSGTWSVDAPVWTDTSGIAVGPMIPVPGFAIFGGAAGIVTVDGGPGGVSAAGLQFMTDGYRMTGDGLTLVGLGGGIPVIRVGGGATATIDNILAGTSGIDKTDSGTLVLGGQNLYTGNTILSGGMLSVSSDGNLGDVSGALDFEGGTLAITGTGYTETQRTILWGDAGGGFDIVDAANNFTIQQALGGTGDLLKTGAGTLILTGTNSYSGGTTIEAGMLQGDATSLQGDIVNNATLAFAQATDGNFDGMVSGSGQLLKTGAATLTLTGTNSYAGGTMIEAGTLQGDTTSLQGDIIDNGVLAFAQQADGTFNSVISGSGQLVKAGAGTLILTGANSYAGGTEVQAGTLVGTVDAIRGDVINAATVVFDQASDASFGGAIAGLGSADGMMVKRGAGVLTLTGNSALDWGVESGGLRSAADRFTGNAAIGSAGILTLDQSVDGTYAGTINGAGLFAKTGTGALALTGDSGSFTGTTTAAAGELRVTGTLGGNVDIASGATLSGSGAATGAVHIADGGHVVGAQSGTLGLGSLSLTSGANVDVTLGAPGGGAALFDVAGDLTLDGTLNITDGGGFGAGVYRLFDYGGTLTDNGLVLGASGGADPSDLFVQTSVTGQVNLIDAQSVELTFWDGGDAALYDDGAVNGGNGNWTASGRAWTTADGTVNSAMAPQPGFAVFQGDSGAVTIDNSEGQVASTGMQFAVGGYILAGSPLTLSGTSAVIRVGDGTAAGADMTATIDADLTGAAALVKTDLGTLILTGTNSYAGGTVVQAGTLVGNTDSIRGDLVNNAASVFDQTIDASFAGKVSGSGSTVKAGTGTLTLAGVSSTDWLIEQGGLVSSTERFTGNLAVAADASFTFDQTGDGDYAGQLSGTGDVRFGGNGIVGLSGDSSGFQGTAMVVKALSVNGGLGGSLDVLASGRLQGIGTVGTTEVAGTIAPGNSIGTLTVDGDLNFAAGSLYEVEVDPAGAISDFIHVTGRASLAGTVAHIGTDGTYRPSSTYTILTADGGLSGTFTGVTSSYAFLAPSLSYTINSVMLTLQRNDISFCTVSLTANECATGNGVESLGSGTSLYDAIVMLDAPAARYAFNQLSGEIHASTRSALLDDSRFVREAATLRLRRATGGISGRGTADGGLDGPVDNGGLSVWGHGFGSWDDLDGRFGSGTARLGRTTGGLLAGIDGAVSEDWRIGLMGGYSRTKLRVADRDSTATIDNIHVGIYSGGQIGPIGIRVGAAYGWNNLETQRSVAFGGFTPETLKTRYHAKTAQAFGEIGYRIEVTDGAFEPFANIAWVQLRSDRFDEDGGAAALSGGRSTSEIGVSTIGLRMSGHVGGGFDLYGSMGWRRTFGDLKPSVVEAFAGSDAFAITGNPLARNAAALEVGFDRAVAKGLSVGVSYSGQISRTVQDHGFKGTIRWSF